MTEVVFGRSAAGGLRYCGWPETVLSFDQDLSVGDISGDCLSRSRETSLSTLFQPLPEEAAAQRAAVRADAGTLQELLRRAASGEPIRIWYSGKPCDLCGLCWLLDRLGRQGEPDLRVLRLPETVWKGNTLVHYFGWSEVAPEEFRDFLPLEEQLLPVAVRAAGTTWQQLQQENSVLRAVVNGRLVSVPAAFYDAFLQQGLTHMDREFREANLIGFLLGRYQLGLGDGWYALRVEQLLADGTLEVLSQPDDRLYSRTLRRVRV